MDQEFLNRLLVTFRTEAKEHVESMSSRLLRLEGIEDNHEKAVITEDLYREAHSLKGAARAVGILEIEAVCRTLETVFAGLKKNTIRYSKELFDLLHRLINLIQTFMNEYSEEEKVNAFSEYDLIVRDLNTIFEHLPYAPQIEETPMSPQQYPAKEELPRAETRAADLKPYAKKETQAERTIRIPAARMDALLLKIEDLLSVKISFDHMLQNLNELNIKIAEWKKDLNGARMNYSRRRSLDGSGRFKEIEEKLMEFFDKNSGHIASLEEKAAAIYRLSRQSAGELNSKFLSVSDEIRSTLMFPAGYILDLFPKIVRDLSAELGREVRLELSGLDVNVDRRILDEIKEPLIHLIRNAVDHGIEPPAERISSGKPPQGTLSIAVSNIGGSSIEIAISDDGSGIDPESLKEAAVKRGVITREEASRMDDTAALELIYVSDISSSPVITDISGRGLGMPIVREKVTKLGGTIRLQTARGKGTSFRINLPVTLTTLRGVIIKVSGQYFVVPAGFVEQVSRIETSLIKTAENRETVLHNNVPISLVYMHDLLGLKRKNGKSRPQHMLSLILSASGKTAAVAIDSLVDEREIVFKNFNKQLKKVRNLSGATVLGSGRVAIILNPVELMDSIKSGSMKASFEMAQGGAESRRNILVADDSITSRILLKDILESAGFSVSLAVDGTDALAKIKTGNFDLIVTDVEMPRMNGFDLTRALRQDEKFKAVPVILVTALSSPEDKTRGIDSGADAYVVKSSFDQSNLLEVIQRLI
ncbi:MAG: response regulator [archaeon]